MGPRLKTGFEIPTIRVDDLIRSVYGLGSIHNFDKGYAIVFSGDWSGPAKVRLVALEYVGMVNGDGMRNPNAKALWKVKGKKK